MHCIDAEVDGPLGPREVVKPSATLRCEVPNTGSAVDSRRAVHGRCAEQIRREFVGGIDKATGTLEPGLKPP